MKGVVASLVLLCGLPQAAALSLRELVEKRAVQNKDLSIEYRTQRLAAGERTIQTFLTKKNVFRKNALSKQERHLQWVKANTGTSREALEEKAKRHGRKVERTLNDVLIDSVEEFRDEDGVGIGFSAQLTQGGYQQVYSEKDRDQMEVYITRVIQKYNATVLDLGSLAGIVPHYAGTSISIPEPTYTELMRELSTASWLAYFADCATVSLDEAGYNAIADMSSDDQMRAFVRRTIKAHGGQSQKDQRIKGRVLLYDERELFDFAQEHSGTSNRQSYAALLQQLGSVDWLKNWKTEPVFHWENSPQVLAAATSNCSTCAADLYQLQHDGEILKKPTLFIGIFSSPNNWHKRDEARKSWMQDPIFTGPNALASVKFVIGRSDKDWQNFDIDEENRMNGDIERVPIMESYANLPHKSLIFFRNFAKKYCCTEALPRYWYVMKLDDDSYPNLDTILPYLHEHKEIPSSMNYVGGLLWNGPVLREGKWAETADKSKFSLKQYPAYAAGSGYIISLDLARKMDEMIEEKGITILRNEDTTIGNFFHEQNHLTMSVNYHDMHFREYGCEEGVFVAMNLCPGEMRCMWEKRLKRDSTGDDDMCCNPPEQYGLPKEGCLPAHQ